MPTPNNVIVELNQLLYKFLWSGTDKVTRLSTINEFEKGGLRMIDLECMIKSLRLAWLKRISSKSEGTWKNYLRHILVSLDYTINSLFYSELLTWWSEFRLYGIIKKFVLTIRQSSTKILLTLA